MSEPGQTATQARRRSRLLEAVIDGLVTGVTLVVLILILNAITGNQQQRALTDIKSAARAQVCVLTLPVGPKGRDEGATNSLCLIPNGIAPVDTNGDGIIETKP